MTNNSIGVYCLRPPYGNYRLRWGAILIYLAAYGSAHAADYSEPGRPGAPASWRTPEFRADWGLGAINADQAYAAGYSGKGVKLGIFDQPVYAKHPEFSGENKVINLVTQGIREYTDPYIPVKKGDPFYYDGTPSPDSDGTLGSHGTHVGGIAAASRDGSPMHGVAYGAQIISAENGDPGPEDGIILGNDGAVYGAGWKALVDSGARIINNSWGIGITAKFERGGDDPAFPHFTVADAQKQFDQIRTILGTVPGGAYQGAIDAARSGAVIIFAAGNDGNLNNPDAMSGLAYFVPDIAPNWLSVASLQDPQRDGNYGISSFSSRCGYTASFCVAAPGSRIYSSVIDGSSADNVTTGYANYNGTSMAAPHVAGSIAVLMERFPYMTGAQVAEVLKTTATDMGNPGIDPLYGWEMINLGKAVGGPGMLVTEEDIPEAQRINGAYGPTQFVVDLPGTGAVLDEGKPTQRVCDSVLCGLDVWRNDISGHGGLTKLGIGTLVLAGTNTYSGPTLVNQGRLAINGSVTSDVSVQGGGIVGGSGRVGSLTVNSGGTAAPGNSIGTLRVDREVRFEPGSDYRVEVAPGGRSDRIEAARALLGGGTVSVSLENSANLLSQGEAQSLLGEKYAIITTAEGVSGRFNDVSPSYPLITPELSYGSRDVGLEIARTDVAFDSLGQTENEKSVARAVESLQEAAPTASGHPVFESVLASRSADEARRAFRQLGGQVHADIASALVNDSRYLRETLNGRLRQSEGLAGPSEIKSDEGGAWAQLLGAWDHASGTSNATGYQSNTYGVLLGLDSEVVNDWRLGVATGYSRTSLDGGHGAKGDSDNYHLAAYGGREFGNLAFRSGAAYTWHRIGTSRDIAWGAQRDRASSSYSARTAQLFAETGYAVKAEWVNLEPFANLAYVNFENNRIAEHGGAAALGGGKQHTDATLSTLGLRADTTWQVAKETAVSLRGEAGWQHQYGDRDRATGLHFRHSDASFVTNSVPVSRDGLVLKAGAEVAVNDNAALTLGYGGLLSSNHQDNSVNAGFNWRF